MAKDNLLSVEEISLKLKQKLLHLIPAPGGYETEIEGLRMSRLVTPNVVEQCFYKPIIVLLLQGTKNSIIGSQKISYGGNSCMLTGADMPAANYLTDISPAHPLLAISLRINKQIITELLAGIAPLKEKEDPLRALTVTKADPYVMDAFLRLSDLIGKPKEQAVLAPMIIREIHYRMLTGPQGNHLKSIYTLGTQSNKIAKAISWLMDNFKKPLNVEELAKNVNMAPSTFFRRFKDVTTLSPLQYQKRLRLHEAHRLMLEKSENATTAAYAVGYESATQFNREYKRMFGAPPIQGIKNILGV